MKEHPSRGDQFYSTSGFIDVAVTPQDCESGYKAAKFLVCYDSFSEEKYFSNMRNWQLKPHKLTDPVPPTGFFRIIGRVPAELAAMYPIGQDIKIVVQEIGFGDYAEGDTIVSSRGTTYVVISCGDQTITVKRFLSQDGAEETLTFGEFRVRFGKLKTRSKKQYYIKCPCCNGNVKIPQLDFSELNINHDTERA